MGVCSGCTHKGSDQEVSRRGADKVARAGSRRVSGRALLWIVPPQLGQAVRSRPVSLSKSCCHLSRWSSTGGVGGVG